MRFTLNFVTPLLAAGAAAVAIAGAPAAVAAPSASQPTAGAAAPSAPSDPASGQQCTSLGGSQSVCQSPGNAQVYDAPPQVDFYPYAGGAT
jgi:hypothetical protein